MSIEQRFEQKLPNFLPPSKREALCADITDLRDRLRKEYPERSDLYDEMLRRAQDPNIAPDEFKRLVIKVRALNNLDAYMTNPEKMGKVLQAKRGQHDVFHSLEHFLETRGPSEKDKGYITLPTGVGKTVIFTELTNALKIKTCIVLPTNLILDQTVASFAKFRAQSKGIDYDALTKKEKQQLNAELLTDIGVVNGNAKEFGRRITLTTPNSLMSNMKKGNFQPHDFELYIYDEAHTTLGDKRSALIKKLPGIQIGLTATPDYNEDKQLASLFPDKIHDITITEAITKGYICNIQSEIWSTGIDYSKPNTQPQPVNTATINTTTGSPMQQSMYDRPDRNAQVIDAYLQKSQGKSGKAIVFCANQLHAEHITEIFNAAGIPAAVLIGKTPKGKEDDTEDDLSLLTPAEKKLRQNIIKLFRAGKIKVIVGVNLIAEGFDDQEVDLGIRLAPTFDSRLKATQSLGRVARIYPLNLKKIALFLDFLDDYANNRQPILASDILGAPAVFALRHDKQGHTEMPQSIKDALADENIFYRDRELRQQRIEPGTEYLFHNGIPWADIDTLREEDKDAGRETSGVQDTKQYLELLAREKIELQKTLPRFETIFRGRMRTLYPVATVIKAVGLRLTFTPQTIHETIAGDLMARLMKDGSIVMGDDVYIQMDLLKNALPIYYPDDPALFAKIRTKNLIIHKLDVPNATSDIVQINCLRAEDLLERLKSLHVDAKKIAEALNLTDYL